MSKLGLYVQVGHDPEIRGKLERVRPAVVLCHLDGGDLIPWIRRTLPETFVIGRYWWAPADQDRLLYAPGVTLAQQVLSQKGGAQCQAMMLFNEYLSSPYEAGWVSLPGKPDRQPDTAWLERAQRYDALQVEFREALMREGVEAVAWNFAAGNWASAQWYRDLQPLSLQAYRYLGFHVYGWPRVVADDWRSNLAETMWIADELGQGQPQGAARTVVTELAVTRMYGGQGPDVGWLSEPEPLTLESYAQDLERAHGELCKRPYVMGAALFNAAPEATWRTFAVTQELINRVSGFKCQEGGRPGEPGSGPPVQPGIGLPVRLRMPFDHASPVSRVTQWYGEGKDNPTYKPWAHEGIDFALNAGYDVRAACDGVVDAFKTSDAYGTYVRILSDGVLLNVTSGASVKGKWQTVYAHLSKRSVKAGQVVKAGDKIGEVGSTGNSTGPHLHFGLRLPGQKGTDPYWGYSDPAPWLGLAKATQPSQTAADLLDQAMALLVKAKELMR